jgi:hypothetical protein
VKSQEGGELLDGNAGIPYQGAKGSLRYRVIPVHRHRENESVPRLFQDAMTPVNVGEHEADLRESGYYLLPGESR